MKFAFSAKYKCLLVVLLILSLLIPLLNLGCTAFALKQDETNFPEDNTDAYPDTHSKIEEKTLEELERERLEQLRQEEEERRKEEEKQLEERRLREEALREELGPFFVPLPPLEQEDNPPVKAKGIYLTGNTVGLQHRFESLMEMVDTTELNAMVIDVKNDHGVMSYRSEIEIVQEAGANRSVPIKNISEVMEELKKRDIYPIARVVVFKDPNLPEKRPEWAIQRNGGGVWRDNKRVAWVNPYEKKVWDYNIAIAKEAALVGFREIQFDYVRFPENAHRVDREAYYPGADGKPKDVAIQDFLVYAREQLEEYNVHIAADVFGVIATSWGDSDRIGQTWEKIAPCVEYSCPMIYPSHYSPGYFGFPVPDANPVGTVRHALTDAVQRNAPIENPGIIRPWLQSFTATWIRGHIRYGPEEVRAQIDTALELGIDEFFIWNAVNRYYPESFLTMEESREREEKARLAREEKGHDVLGRTTSEALELFMDAVRRKNWREAYVLQGTDFAVNHDDYKNWVEKWTGRLSSYEAAYNSEDEDKTIYGVNYSITAGGEEINLEGEIFEVYKENNIWKVKPSEKFTELLTCMPEPQENAQ